MLRHRWAAAAAVLAAACSGSAPRQADTSLVPAGNPARVSDALHAIADQFLDEVLRARPEATLAPGLPVAYHDQLSDPSLSALAALHGLEDRWLGELRALDAEALGDADRVLYATLVETVEASVGQRICRDELWAIDHMGGWQVRYALLAGKQPVGTAEARAAALARWRLMPARIRTHLDNLRRGLSEGYSAPVTVVDKVLVQLDAAVDLNPEQSPLYGPAKRDSDPDFAAALRAVIADEIQPAMGVYRDFLRDQYRPRARTELAITAHPHGAECYEASLRAYTSLKQGSARTVEAGEALVARNAAEIAELGERLFGTRDLQEIVRRVGADPDYQLIDGAAVLAFAQATAERNRVSLDRWFDPTPKAVGSIEPWPAGLGGSGANDQYEQPSAGNPRGVYRINLSERRNKANLEITAAHELYPGHHLQIALALELPKRHPVLLLLGNSAFSEGWARYAESLAEEMGTLTLDGSKVLRRSWPGRGMVADPGLHVGGWSREQVVVYLREAGRFADDYVVQMPDRIAMSPGQLTAYDSGASVIFGLRAEAEQALGDAFDLKEFHARVLENGAVPLWFLQQQVRTWIRRRASSGPG